jgi:TIR domain
MKIFLSHARKDVSKAYQLSEELRRVGFAVWLSEEEIAPGDNWAEKTGRALKEAELMVLLLSPGAMESDSLRQNLEFALGARKFEGRVFSVFVGPTLKAGKDMPWILLKLPHSQVESAKEFGEVAKEIQALVADSDLSTSNA